MKPRATRAADTQFDFIVCRAAFKNFAGPLVALNEMHRVLKPGGNALIIDLRKDFSPRAVKDYARRHGLFAGPFIRLTFYTVLKKRAYTKDSITELGGAVSVRARRSSHRSDRLRIVAA